MYVNQPTILSVSNTVITTTASATASVPQSVKDLVLANSSKNIASLVFEYYDGPAKALSLIKNTEWKYASTYSLNSRNINSSSFTSPFNLTYANATTGAYIRAKIVINLNSVTSSSAYNVYNTPLTIVNGNIPAPYYILPSGGVYDTSQIIKLEWKLPSGQENKIQTRYDIEWNYYGSAVINSITGYSNNRYHYIPENTFNSPNQIVWRIRLYGTSGNPSPWSSYAKFSLSSASLMPTIISPLNNETITLANPIIEWTSISQKDYALRIVDVDTQVEVFTDTHLEESASTIYELKDYNLENNKSYQIFLKIKNNDGIWSTEDSITIITSFETPEMPIVTKTLIKPEIDDYGNYNGGPLTIIEIENPATGIPVLRNDLYRIDYYISDFEQNIAVPGLPNTSYYDRMELLGTKKLIETDIGTRYVDYTIGAGYYIYFVRTWGTNGTYIDTIYTSDDIIINQFEGFILMPESSKYFGKDPEEAGSISFRNKAIYIDYYTDNHNETFTPQITYTNFYGRKNPVAQIGAFENNNINIDFDLITDIDIITFNRMVSKKEPILYRDESGNNFYTILDSKNIKKNNNFSDVINVNINLTKIQFNDYIEKLPGDDSIIIQTFKGYEPTSESVIPIIYIDKEDVE